MPSVLFVCLGNICRSPTAHGVFEHYVREAALNIEIDSAGTGAWHVGNKPDVRARAAAKQRGFSLDHIRARQVEPADFDKFDYILAMDEQNLADLQAMAPAGYSGHLGLFLAFGSQRHTGEVPDPYYGGNQGFEHVLDLVEDAARGLLHTVTRGEQVTK